MSRDFESADREKGTYKVRTTMTMDEDMHDAFYEAIEDLGLSYKSELFYIMADEWLREHGYL